MILFIAILGSVAWRTGQGYNAKGETGKAMGLFNGPFYHSNLMGPMAAMIILYLSSLFVFGRGPSRLLTAGLGAVFLVFLYWSKSRTGMATMLIGLTALIFVAQFFRHGVRRRIRLNISPTMLVLSLFVLVAGAVVYNQVRGGVILAHDHLCPQRQ